MRYEYIYAVIPNQDLGWKAGYSSLSPRAGRGKARAAIDRPNCLRSTTPGWKTCVFLQYLFRRGGRGGGLRMTEERANNCRVLFYIFSAAW
jgi:hypothetical protein